ncbi:MAG TPA: xanthine dehydrogenase family protein molybdopterin-binding subunit, partial [Clostridia bacterium]|nr:xanthine dehydrogenase family protein molybdopterin-binding subunit [Clostridia bacterium]
MNIHRKEAWDKVTGRAKYTDDFPAAGYLCARLVTSTRAHARILSIDASKALSLKGVAAVVTGADCAALFGPLLQDRPALARGIVRYAGEPVALCVAVDEPTAQAAARLVAVEYADLPVTLTPAESLAAKAAPIHEDLAFYRRVMPDVRP